MLGVLKAAHYINVIHTVAVVRIVKFSKCWQFWVRQH